MSKPRLPDHVRNSIRPKHYTIRTEEGLVRWISQYIFFHTKRHSAEMGEQEFSRFLSHLAANRKVASSTQDQALSPLLYPEVLGQPLDQLEPIKWGQKPAHTSLAPE